MLTKRIFVSVDLPTEVKDYLRSLQKSNIYWIKWMKPQNLHITLSFLGDLIDSKLAELKLILTEIAAAYHPFKLKFTDFHQERDMLWLLPEENQALSDLQQDLQKKFREQRLGKTERRHYAPHVLIAKSKTGRPMIWRPENFSPQEFEVDRINLYESKLTPDAATHILIQSFALGNPTPTLSPPVSSASGGRIGGDEEGVL